MTDKQTMVDGVDVSKCVSFDDCNGHNICCYLDTREDKIPFANFCEENKDCNFKQLARAREENEKLRMQNEILSKNNAVQQWCDMYNKKNKECFDALLKLTKKEQECEELKETIDNFTTDNNSLYLNDGKQPSNLDEFQECMQSSMDKFYKYEQALDEIEKYFKSKDKSKTSLFNIFVIEQEILDIINKAKQRSRNGINS